MLHGRLRALLRRPDRRGSGALPRRPGRVPGPDRGADVAHRPGRRHAGRLLPRDRVDRRGAAARRPPAARPGRRGAGAAAVVLAVADPGGLRVHELGRAAGRAPAGRRRPPPPRPGRPGRGGSRSRRGRQALPRGPGPVDRRRAAGAGPPAGRAGPRPGRRRRVAGGERPRPRRRPRRVGPVPAAQPRPAGRLGQPLVRRRTTSGGRPRRRRPQPRLGDALPRRRDGDRGAGGPAVPAGGLVEARAAAPVLVPADEQGLLAAVQPLAAPAHGPGPPEGGAVRRLRRRGPDGVRRPLPVPRRADRTRARARVRRLRLRGARARGGPSVGDRRLPERRRPGRRAALSRRARVREGRRERG